MRSRTRSIAALVLGVAALLVVLGCAATKPEDMPGDPKLIRDEITKITAEISNTEEMLKGSRAQLQVDDSQDLRDEIRRYEAEIGQLKSRRTALEQRLRELEAQ
jgi:septal ring factor EnvC (AmiA/AmiB activator)